MQCSALGITGDLLDGCIFDVVITGDLTMVDQEVLKIGQYKESATWIMIKNINCEIRKIA